MSLVRDTAPLVWRLHLRSPPSAAYRMLATDEGRSKFWAESAVEAGGSVHFKFPNGREWTGRLIERAPPHRLVIQYLGGSVVTFRLEADGRGGTDLTLTDEGVPAAERGEVAAGWVSVLLALKAALDFGVDLRNHDAGRTWDAGFVDNQPGQHAAAHRFVSRAPVVPARVEVFDDPVAELLRRGVELRFVPSLWALRDAVVASSLQFSLIRVRNARPRATA